MSNYIELLVTLGFLGALMWGMMKFMLRDIHHDISDIKSELHEFKQEFRESSLRHEARIDHLYEENNKIYHLIMEIVSKK